MHSVALSIMKATMWNKINVLGASFLNSFFCLFLPVWLSCDIKLQKCNCPTTLREVFREKVGRCSAWSTYRIKSHWVLQRTRVMRSIVLNPCKNSALLLLCPLKPPAAGRASQLPALLLQPVSFCRCWWRTFASSLPLTCHFKPLWA